jgi:hypothetical protein
MTIEMKKVWFDGEKVVTQNIPESDIYKRHWDIASCKAYAEQLRDKNRANTAEHAAEAIEYLLALAQPDQEPVAWMDEDGDVLSASIIDGKGLRNIPLYTTPPKHTWVGLTDEDRLRLWLKTESEDVDRYAFAKAIEAELKDKNR